MFLSNYQLQQDKLIIRRSHHFNLSSKCLKRDKTSTHHSSEANLEALIDEEYKNMSKA